jgi:hypothetical protein
VLCVLLGGRQALGSLWAAGGKTSPGEAFVAKALSGLCGLLGESEIVLQLFSGYVLRVRLLILQFSKTAIF